ncbi:hypothetical protein [Streptomyces sp. NPDC127098]|uniref:hypothetical protein n=1 Tax=Streptomyces sp. NPDC127098 TaxID=3347137 RepID=UPI00365C10FA
MKEDDDGRGATRMGTGFLLTRIEREANGWYRWSRWPGPLRPTPFTPLPPALPTALNDLPAMPVRPVLGRPAGDRRDYRAPRDRALAAELFDAAGLFAPPAEDRWPRLWQVLAGAGALLRRLHEDLPPALPARPPCGAARLASWLRTGQGPGAAPRLHAATIDRLGRQRLGRAQDWCRDLDVPAPDAVLLVGATTGSLVAGAEGRPGALLIGEELASGSPEYDVGWLLGELAELRLLPLARTGSHRAAAACEEGARHLLRGYGDNRLGPEPLGRVATLRILTHAHDYAAYAGWTAEFPDYLDVIAGLIDADGTPALPAPPP